MSKAMKWMVRSVAGLTTISALGWGIVLELPLGSDKMLPIAGALSLIPSAIGVQMIRRAGVRSRAVWLIMFLLCFAPFNFLGWRLLEEGYPNSSSLMFWSAGIGLVLLFVSNSPALELENRIVDRILAGVFAGACAGLGIYAVTGLMRVELFVALLMVGLAIVLGMFLFGTFHKDLVLPYVLGVLIALIIVVTVSKAPSFVANLVEAAVAGVLGAIASFAGYGSETS